jgi:hypothetical protein
MRYTLSWIAEGNPAPIVQTFDDLSRVMALACAALQIGCRELSVDDGCGNGIDADAIAKYCRGEIGVSRLFRRP